MKPDSDPDSDPEPGTAADDDAADQRSRTAAGRPARLGSTADVQRFASFSAPVTALAYGDKGRTLAIGTNDGTVELQDVPTHTRTLTLTPTPTTDEGTGPAGVATPPP